VRWDRDGQITDLGTLPGLPVSVALRVNNAGTVIGYATTSDRSQQHAVVWH